MEVREHPLHLLFPSSSTSSLDTLTPFSLRDGPTNPEGGLDQTWFKLGRVANCARMDM